MNEEITSAAESTEVKEEIPLIGYLKKLAEKQDRGALAHLRRGLGKRPGEASEMFRYIGRFLGERRNDANDRAIFLTSALFAFYNDAPGNAGNLGSSLRRMDAASQNDSLEKRFVALLDAEGDDLHYHLRQMIALVRADNAPVNWGRLYKDIRNWDSDSRYVQTAWARSFWGSAETNKQPDPQPEGEKE